jgi:predicted DNA-binding transcriptional regulator YafY
MPRLRSNEAQATRCIALLVAMARARRGVMLRPFAERRGWNPRAAYRDIETLRAAGVPVEHDEHGWYRVSDGWIPAGTVDVKHDELLALHVARRLAPGLKNTAVGRSLDTLLAKLATPNRQTALPLGDEPAFRCPEAAAIDLAPHRATIELVQEAIRARRALRICYRKPGDDAEHARVIEPGFLYWCPVNEALYVRAYCRERVDFRLFAIHRIASIALLDDLFARRPDPAWDARGGFRLWHRTSAERVSIRFSPMVAGEICERRWHATQHLTPTLEGGVVLEMDVAAPEELERWLLGYGPDAVVLAPASLAERLRRRHAEAAGLRAGPLRARRSRTSRQDAAPPTLTAGERASARR